MKRCHIAIDFASALVAHRRLHVSPLARDTPEFHIETIHSIYDDRFMCNGSRDEVCLESAEWSQHKTIFSPMPRRAMPNPMETGPTRLVSICHLALTHHSRSLCSTLFHTVLSQSKKWALIVAQHINVADEKTEQKTEYLPIL